MIIEAYTTNTAYWQENLPTFTRMRGFPTRAEATDDRVAEAYYFKSIVILCFSSNPCLSDDVNVPPCYGTMPTDKKTGPLHFRRSCEPATKKPF
jgi:hypothetical protein